MFDEIWDLLQAHDTYLAIERIGGQPNPQDALELFAELVRRCYHEKHDLAATLAMGRAGIQFGLTSAAALAEAQPDLAYELRSRAKALAYNVGSSAWPGWGEPGIVISLGDLAVGMDAALANLRLARDLAKGDLPLSRAHWLVGAHLMAGADYDQARVHFELAGDHARAAGELGDELLDGAYLHLATLLANPADQAARQGLESAKAALAPLEYGDFFVGQLDTALAAFGPNAAA